MRKYLFLIFITSLIYGCSDNENQIRLSQIQILGSHNSYKLKIHPSLWRAVYDQDSTTAMELDYGHIPLKEQLNLGIRALEFDVFHDPEGGRYSVPFGIFLMLKAGNIPEEFDGSAMRNPGLKVLHIQGIDFRSHNSTFKSCLREINDWSKKHPNHLPIIITINAKDDILKQPDFVKPLPFTANALDSIDLEIRSVFKEKQLITPYLVRGDSSSLEASVLNNGWPTLENSRGKFLFVLDENDQKLDRYIKGHPSLGGRVMFVNAPIGTPEAAFVIMNDPVAAFEKIQNLVKKGYLVRTRADSDTWEARRNDLTRFEKALESGAQVISTDYYLPDSSLGTGYQVRFQNDKIALCNPMFQINRCDINED
jgi:Phosphoinositide phospholipase C, Ca2+-dependent